jgi:hypothetical protein
VLPSVRITGLRKALAERPEKLAKMIKQNRMVDSFSVPLFFNRSPAPALDYDVDMMLDQAADLKI